MKSKWKELGSMVLVLGLIAPVSSGAYHVKALNDPYIGLLEYAMKVKVKSAPSSSSKTIATLKFGQSAAFIGEVKGNDGLTYNLVKIRKNGKLLTGYVYNKKFSFGSYFMPYKYDPSFESTVNKFPASYRQALRYIHSTYPKWKMYPVNVNLDFNQVASYYQKTSNIDSSLNTLKQGSSPVEGKNWYRVNLNTAKYFLDPRNYLNAYDAVTFNKLSYDSQETLDDVKEMLAGTSVYPYAKYLVAAAKKYDVSLFNIAARAFSEQGYNGGLGVLGATAKDKKGNDLSKQLYYNIFNVKAYTGAQDGINYAREVGWTTPQKSIDGGVKFLKDNYLGKNQWATYYQKFNVYTGKMSELWHSYMANIRTPLTEGEKLWRTYSDSTNHLDEKSKNLYIPIYKNMPSTKVSYPDKTDTYLTNEMVTESDLPYSSRIKNTKVTNVKASLKSGNRIYITYDGVKIAKSYIIEYQVNNSGWKKLTNTTSTKILTTTFSAGNRFRFRIKVSGSSVYAYTNYVYTLKAQSSLSSAKVTNLKAQIYGYDDIVVTFNKVKGASKYILEYKRKSWKSWKSVTTLTTNTYKQSNRADNADYQYRVKVVGSKYYTYSNVVYTLGKISKPSIKKVSNSKIMLSWKKANNTAGYEIFRNGKFFAWAASNKTTRTVSVARNKKYTYQIRTYNKYGNKYFFAPLSDKKTYTLK